MNKTYKEKRAERASAPPRALAQQNQWVLTLMTRFEEKLKMKFTLNAEVTPKEARAFLGLPDVEPINDMIMQEMMRRTQENIDTLANPERLIAQWMTVSGKGIEQFQNLMGGVVSRAASAAKSATGSSKKK